MERAPPGRTVRRPGASGTGRPSWGRDNVACVNFAQGMSTKTSDGSSSTKVLVANPLGAAVLEGDIVEVDAVTAPARMGGEDGGRVSRPPPGCRRDRRTVRRLPARNRAVRSPGGGSARPERRARKHAAATGGEALAGARALVGAARRGTPQGCVLERPGERPAGVRAGGLRHGPARSGVGRSSSAPGGLGESVHRHGTRWPLDVRATGDCDSGGSPVGQRCSKKFRVGSTPVIVRVDAGVVEFLVDPEPRGLVDPSAGPVCRIVRES